MLPGEHEPGSINAIDLCCASAACFDDYPHAGRMAAPRRRSAGEPLPFNNTEGAEFQVFELTSGGP